jgi:curved DNA-binding protein CbpA
VAARKNFYQVLQVDPMVDDDILATVHRRLAQRYHPDRDSSPEAMERIREINHAYDVLRNRESRATYDAELARRRDRRSSDRYVRQPGGSWVGATEGSPYGEAGPPRGPASGSVLDFGRYKGWTLGQIAAYDPDFLDWFERSPAGRQFRNEIGQLKGRLGSAPANKPR